MIVGSVNTDREAIVRLMILGPQGREREVEAIVDTGSPMLSSEWSCCTDTSWQFR